MDCCKHCNFKNTDKCDLYKIGMQFEEGEISEDEAESLSYDVLMRCEDSYHDYQLDYADAKEDR